MYVSQIIMLYTLNLYRPVCQLYLNKIGRKKAMLLQSFCKDEILKFWKNYINAKKIVDWIYW